MTTGRVRRAQQGKLKLETRKGAWSKKQLRTFFDHLAATCNVKAATTAAGICYTSVFRRRVSDPSFAALWDDALEVGEARLEALVLEKALSGADLEGVVPDPERAEVAFDMKNAMAVLASRDARLKRAGRGPQVACMPIDQVEALLLRRLAGLAKRGPKTVPAAAGKGGAPVGDRSTGTGGDRDCREGEGMEPRAAASGASGLPPSREHGLCPEPSRERGVRPDGAASGREEPGS